MRFVRLFCAAWVCLSTGTLRADSLEETVQLHREAMGGMARLEALVAMRAVGHVVTAGQRLEFELIAQRPNCVRITMRGGERTLVQGCDGVNPPWRWEPGKPQSAALMKTTEGRDFAADAEFDDPLVSSPDRGYRLDFAGRVAWRDQQVSKILVTRNGMAPAFLLVDPETFFIVARLTSRRLPSGRELVVETRYDRYRPVAGVILPHRVETFVDGQRTGELVLTTVQSIARPPAETFAMPAGA